MKKFSIAQIEWKVLLIAAVWQWIGHFLIGFLTLSWGIRTDDGFLTRPNYMLYTFLYWVVVVSAGLFIAVKAKKQKFWQVLVFLFLLWGLSVLSVVKKHGITDQTLEGSLLALGSVGTSALLSIGIYALWRRWRKPSR